MSEEKEEDYTITEEEEERIAEERQKASFEKAAKESDRIHGKYYVVGDGNGKTKSKKKNEEEDSLKACYVQKHSGSVNGILIESVIIGQRPLFAMSRKIGDRIEIKLVQSLKDEIYEYQPLGDSDSRPYTLRTEEDFSYYIEQAKKEDLDSLYRKVKHVCQKYIDADNFHISILAADIIFTYFQDKIGMTHYLFFVGGNDTGKSNNLKVIQYVGYRNFNSYDITHANIYTFLGNNEEGQGTICEDEADNIDYDYEKMKIYKGGYTAGAKVARIDLPHGKRIQNKWNTYCFKAFAGERLPDSLRAKGFHQRIVELHCRDGLPRYDIAEVVTTAGEEEFQYLLDELNATHNLLLAYRLLHFHDKIPNIKLNISNREKQLFKPVLRVFQNTDTFNDLLPVISEFISRRREKNVNTLEAVLYDTVIELIGRQKKLELESGTIWEELKNNLSGQEVPNRPLSYESETFGRLSQKRITETLVQVFGAKKPRHKGSSRRLIFDQDRLKRLSRKYAITVNIKVTTNETETEESGADGALGALVGDIGLDAHTSKNEEGKEIAEIEHNNEDNLHKNSEDNRNSVLEDNPNMPTHTLQPPQCAPTAPKFYRCYHNSCEFETDNQLDYEKHGALKHLKNPLLYPSKAEIKQYNLKSQGKEWEI